MVPLTEVRNSGGRAEVTDMMGDRYLALSPVKCEMCHQRPGGAIAGTLGYEGCLGKRYLWESSA